MADHATFLRAVIAAPGDDNPRLAYADWLDENDGHEWAAFIRVQCRIAALQALCGCGGCVRLRGGGQHHNGPCAVAQERDELPDGRSTEAFLWRQENYLFATDAARSGRWWWVPAEGEEPYRRWPRTVHPPQLEREMPLGRIGSRRIVHPGPAFLIRRGFPERLNCPAADWLAHADAVTAALPLTSVTMTTWPGTQRRVAPRPPSARNPKARLVWDGDNPGCLRYPWHDLPDDVPTYDRPHLVGWLLVQEWPKIRFTLPGDADG